MPIDKTPSSQKLYWVVTYLDENKLICNEISFSDLKKKHAKQNILSDAYLYKYGGTHTVYH